MKGQIDGKQAHPGAGAPNGLDAGQIQVAGNSYCRQVWAKMGTGAVQACEAGIIQGYNSGEHRTGAKTFAQTCGILKGRAKDACADGYAAGQTEAKIGPQITTTNPAAGGFQTSNVQDTLPNGGSDQGDTKPNCDNNDFSLAFIACPVIYGASDAINGIYRHLIEPLLNIDASRLIDSSQPFYKVWNSFRIYADVLLVIMLIVIVFGESISGGA